MPATLIVSMSGVTEPTLPASIEFTGELDARLLPVSWLLPPRPREGRHRADAPLIRWLRSRLPVGDALVMHGFDHTVVPAGRSWPYRRAEFAALPSHEATLRLIAATRTLDDLGLSSEVFAPPRWLASSGTLTALRRRGFRVCADSIGVRRLNGAEALLRGRVLTPGGLTAGVRAVDGPAPESTEAWRHRGLLLLASRTARRGGLVRIDVDATDLHRASTRQVLLDAIDAALEAGATPATYRLPLPTRLAA